MSSCSKIPWSSPQAWMCPSQKSDQCQRVRAARCPGQNAAGEVSNERGKLSFVPVNESRVKPMP